MEALENEAPESPAVIHFTYLGSINNIIDIDGIVNFPEITENDTGILTCSWRWGKQGTLRKS